MATWAGLLTGLAEGIVFLLARSYPLLNAAHKVPIEGMWVAPVFDAVVWSIAGFLGALPLLWGPVTRQWRSYVLVMSFLMTFAGAGVVLSAPGMIQQYGVVIFSAGMAVAVCRKIAGREELALGWARRRIAGVPFLLLCCFLIVTLGAAGKEKYSLARLPQADAHAPNVIVMVLDTVRWDRLAPNSYSKIKTPELDRIARESAVFANAWATGPWSLPSQLSLVTGRDPSEHGGDWHLGKLRDGIPTLGSYLQDRGYVTGAFSGNASWITPEYFGQGFQHFQPIPVAKIILRLTLGRRLAEHIPAGTVPLSHVAELVNQAFWKWAGQRSGRPFFAYLCYMDVNNSGHEDVLHLPEQAIARYDQALEALDRRIGELDRELEKRGLKENTILIVTSDHGESFGRLAQDHAETLHMTSVYPEQMRVPLMIRWPKKLAGGTVAQQTVSLKQVPATIEKLLGSKTNVFQAPMDFAEGPAADDACVFGELRELHGRRTQAMVACGGWQFIRRETTEELYDLSSDAGARTNRIETTEAAAQRERMRSLLKQWLQEQDEAALRR